MLKKIILPSIAHLFLIASFISLLPIWIGDLFSHFRMFWSIFSVVLFITYIIFFNQKKVHFKIVMSVFFSLLINFVSSYSFWTNSQTYEYLFFGSPIALELPDNPDEDVQKDTTVKSLLLMNILSSNTNYEKVRELIKDTDADFVVILELNQKWENELKDLKQNYKYQFTEVKEDNFGMGFYAKEGSYFENQLNFRIENSFDSPELPPCIYFKNIEAKKDFKLLILHPTPPVSKKAYLERNLYLEKAVTFIKSESNKNTLFVGDLNCSPFSPHYKKILKNSGLKDSQENFGFQPTWNSSFPFLMQTQLDHVWHSEDIEILHRQTLPIFGSDHKAVLVVFR